MSLRRGRLLQLLAAVLAAAAAHAQQPPPLSSRSDLAGLYSLRASLGLRARDWPLRSDPCASWSGVACRGGRVVGVTVAGLRRTRLAARAPRLALDGLRNLTALERFNASGFALPGRIPAWFGAALPRPLAVLDLSAAAVSGALPAGLGAAGNLTQVLLAGNSLEGPVPPSLLDAAGLLVLDLSRNNFTGALPNVSAAAAAALLNVSSNSLYGVAGGALATLRARFQVVDVSSNYLGGPWKNGSDGAVLATMNCFDGVPGQRSRVDCEDFYSKHGARLADAPSPQPSPEEEEKKKNAAGISRNLLIGVLVAAGALMVVFLAVLMFCLVKRRSRGRIGAGGRGLERNEEGSGARSMRRRDSSVNPVATLPPAVSPSANAGPKDVSADPGEFTYEQLVYATGGFGDDKLIKHGHSGDIYHGVLENGSHVIVKKVDAKGAGKNAGELDFYSRYSHDRIVPLLAHLSKDDEEFLAYKYMPKGDLTTALHKKPVDDADGLPSLDWITRLKIATGVAEAMCFLHDECSPPLVHRDIQASSVLLDDKYEVRLGSMSDICVQQSGGSQNVFSRILRSSNWQLTFVSDAFFWQVSRQAHIRSTGHLFLRRPLLRQGSAGSGDGQLGHQRAKRGGVRGVGGVADEHAEPHQRRRQGEHQRHHRPAARGGRGPPGGGVGGGRHRQGVPGQQAVAAAVGAARAARPGEPAAGGAAGLVPVQLGAAAAELVVAELVAVRVPGQPPGAEPGRVGVGGAGAGPAALGEVVRQRRGGVLLVEESHVPVPGGRAGARAGAGSGAG
ncbi:hypothetical protein BS78_02G028300 [Paspalum vaginatum]|nr:hypothetical protein BS78_02G028300 [Paspalum vaginatum]